MDRRPSTAVGLHAQHARCRPCSEFRCHLCHLAPISGVDGVVSCHARAPVEERHRIIQPLQQRPILEIDETPIDVGLRQSGENPLREVVMRHIRVLTHAAPVHRSADQSFAAVILALILICPHVNAYDLILLCPLYFLLAECFADGTFESRRLALPLLLFASFLSPLLAVLPAVIRLQFSVTAMAATLMMLRSKAV